MVAENAHKKLVHDSPNKRVPKRSRDTQIPLRVGDVDTARHKKRANVLEFVAHVKSRWKIIMILLAGRVKTYILTLMHYSFCWKRCSATPVGTMSFRGYNLFTFLYYL